MKNQKTPIAPAAGSRRKRGCKDRPVEEQPLAPAEGRCVGCAQKWPWHLVGCQNRVWEWKSIEPGGSAKS